MKQKILIMLISLATCITYGQERDVVQLSVLGGFTPYESSFGIGGAASYSRLLSNHVEIFGTAQWFNGTYTTELPEFSYDNTERVLVLDLGFQANLTPESESNRLLVGIGGSIVGVTYEYGEFVFPESVEMNTVEERIPMFLLRLENRYFICQWLFASAQLSARTSFSEEAVVERSISPSGNIGVTGGVRYTVNLSVGLGYLF